MDPANEAHSGVQYVIVAPNSKLATVYNVLHTACHNEPFLGGNTSQPFSIGPESRSTAPLNGAPSSPRARPVESFNTTFPTPFEGCAALETVARNLGDRCRQQHLPKAGAST